MNISLTKSLLIICTLILINFIIESVSGNNDYNGRVEIKTSGDVFADVIKGITVVAPPKAIGPLVFKKLTDINTEWVCFVPYGFTRKGSTDVRYNQDRQWWGEKIAGIEVCITEAKKQGLKVMLKPQVFMGGGWIGDMDFEKEEQWVEWEKNYRIFIMDYLDVAVKNNAEMFCIGTEFNIAVIKRESFWKELIRDMRKTYKGQLTYSANWDNYDKVGIWKDLDIIGISSYFPLSEARNPTVGLLVKEWKPIVRRLRNFSNKYKKKILFTEYGYMSVDGCAGKSWEIEKNKKNLNINHFAQSNAYDALWTSLSSESFWGGGFLWKWFPDGMGHEGYPEKDYTPQDKPAENIIKKWFSQIKKV
jgi:hypothetical protein